MSTITLSAAAFRRSDSVARVLGEDTPVRLDGASGRALTPHAHLWWPTGGDAVESVLISSRALSAIADATKSANVRTFTLTSGRGGMVTVLAEGEVGPIGSWVLPQLTTALPDEPAQGGDATDVEWAASAKAMRFLTALPSDDSLQFGPGLSWASTGTYSSAVRVGAHDEAPPAYVLGGGSIAIYWRLTNFIGGTSPTTWSTSDWWTSVEWPARLRAHFPRLDRPVEDLSHFFTHPIPGVLVDASELRGAVERASALHSVVRIVVGPEGTVVEAQDESSSQPFSAVGADTTKVDVVVSAATILAALRPAQGDLLLAQRSDGLLTVRVLKELAPVSITLAPLATWS